MAAQSFHKLKKLRGRSFDEIRRRGEQALAAYGEQLGLTGGLPSDVEFVRLLDKSVVGDLAENDANVAMRLLESFGSWRNSQFFVSFDDSYESAATFRQKFGEEAARQIIARADRAVDGEFDLLGFSNLDFGLPIDWHLEPISGKRAPLKHWKLYEELDSGETGDKKIVWELNRHQHFFTLGAAYWLTGDERYAAAFVMHLTGWMRQNPPATGIHWMSSLEIGFRTISWLWALHFFKRSPNLTPTVFRDALKYLFLNGRHIQTYLSTYYSPNTHLTGEALALFYLGTLLPEFRAAAHWREVGKLILLDQLERQILPDGVYFEQTTWYARYTAEFYTHFLILSEINVTLNERDKNLVRWKLQLLLDFLMHTTRPDGTTPTIGDDDGGRMIPAGSLGAVNDFRPTLGTGAALFNRGDYKFVAGSEAAEETFWLLGANGVKQFESIAAYEPRERSKAFPLGGYFVMRDKWSEKSDYLLIDGGTHGALNGGHAHADALAFELAVAGKTLLVDPGTFSYADKTARDYFRASAAHNTLTVDGKSSSQPGGIFDWKTTAEVRGTDFISKPRFDFFEGAHDGFSSVDRKNLITHGRSVLHLKNDYWILRDFISAVGTHDYQLNFHFNAGCGAPELLLSENRLPAVRVLTADGIGVVMQTFGDNGAWETFDDWIAPCYGLKLVAPTVGFTASGEGAQEMFTFLLPVKSPQQREPLLPVINEINARAGRAFAVSFNGNHDLFVYGDEEGETTRTKWFDSNFRFAWARLAPDDEQTIEEIVLISGTNLIYGGREVINYPKRLRYAVVRRAGNRFQVETDDGTFTVSLPKRHSQVFMQTDELLNLIAAEYHTIK